MSELKRRKTGNNFSNLELANHAATLVLDSVESSASAMSFVLYELAANPNIQDKLFEEIECIVGKSEVTFELLQEMKYLDCVCSGWPKIDLPVSECFLSCFFRSFEVTSASFVYDKSLQSEAYLLFST